MLSLLLNLVISVSWASDLIRVAVVDTGLDISDPRFSGLLCPTGHKDFTGTTLNDNNTHGTHVAGIIRRNAKSVNYCLVILKYFDANSTSEQDLSRTLEAFKYADSIGVDIIQYSSGGPVFMESEYLAIKNSKALFVVAAGNNGVDVSLNYYPAAYHTSNMVVVGALTQDGKRKLMGSNFGPLVNVWEIGENVISDLPNGREGPMTGTSMAAPTYTGLFLTGIKSSFKALNEVRHLCLGASTDLRLCRIRP